MIRSGEDESQLNQGKNSLCHQGTKETKKVKTIETF